MHVPTRKRHEYWNHFVEAHFVLGQSPGGGITGPRLAKIKGRIFADEDFWEDIVIRHGGLDKSPEELQLSDRASYNYCLGNFWGLVTQTLIEQGLIRR